MYQLKNWKLKERRPHGIVLTVEDRHELHISVLEEKLFRVTLIKDGRYRMNRTWTVAPDGRAPMEGRLKCDEDGFTLPSFTFEENNDQIVIATSRLKLTVHTPLRLSWEGKTNAGVEEQWLPIAEDRPSGAYLLGRRDHSHSHFLLRKIGERYYGLGEKAGELERSGKRYEMRNLDAMGYDARTTDPLYKHIPFTITRTAEGLTYGLFYDNQASCWFDLGNELDNYHLPFRSYRAEDGDLNYFFMFGSDIREVTGMQTWLTGGTAFPPRWSLGYSGSTMAYTDADNAQEQLAGFLDKIKQHDIPCDSFQLSSGYTSIGSKRYVFNWNTKKFPSLENLVSKFAEAKVRLIANIKPCLLQDHPKYTEVREAGLFIKDSETGEPEKSAFWADEGSHLDFTNPDTQVWWEQGVTQSLLQRGIGSTWNDNNEYEVWDREAQCNGFGQPFDVALARPLQPLLMTRSSENAQRKHAPDKRPYLITRSGCSGIQRHAQTWTGDNRTSWESLRYNIPMGLGLSLSGFFNFGHDVGGFAGPKPDPELFVRWVQNGVFHPRFTIHSWNDDLSVTEPWMYPDMTEHVRNAIKLRYRLLPYLYTLFYLASVKHEPIVRPLFYDFPDDEECYNSNFDFMLGSSLLVATVVEQGATERSVYLPDNKHGWYDFEKGAWLKGGRKIKVPVNIASIPLFVQAGSVLPLSPGVVRADGCGETNRHLAIYPLHSGDGTEATGLIYEDDGEAVDALAGNYRLTEFSLRHFEDRLELDWTHAGSYTSDIQQFIPVNAARDTRDLYLCGKKASYEKSCSA